MTPKHHAPHPTSVSDLALTGSTSPPTPHSDDTLGGTRGGFPSFPIEIDSFLVSPVKSLRSPVKSLRSPTATHRTPRGSVSRNSLSNGGSGALSSLRDVFTEFANFGVRGDERSDTMDGAKFAKFCRETRLQDGKTLDSQSVDIIFSKVKPRGERRITFEEFKDAVAMVGEMRGERFRDISERVASVGGPRARGTTRAEYVKFADPSNFTGAYAANLGFEIKPRKSADLGWKNKILVPSVDADMKRVFTEFCAFGHGNPCSMENKTFVKLLRDCGLIDGDGTCITNFHQTSADLIFAKVKPKGERVICVEDFVLCVLLVAEEIGEPYETIADSVRNCQPPSNNGGTIAEYNKFHDDKELYTGCYAAHFGVEKTPRQRPEWREEHIQGGKRAPPDVPGLKGKCFSHPTRSASAIAHTTLTLSFYRVSHFQRVLYLRRRRPWRDGQREVGEVRQGQRFAGPTRFANGRGFGVHQGENQRRA